MKNTKEKIDKQLEILRHLVSLGKEAERQLEKMTAPKTISWNSLYTSFINSISGDVSETSAVDYRRWTGKIAKWAKANGISHPARLLRKDAVLALDELFAEKVSISRVCRFYRRVWNSLGLDKTVWPEHIASDNSNREYYRRLSAVEIGKLVEYLRTTSCDFHDIVVIAYYTGLRLSDIVELEMSEVSADFESLLIMPNKVRRRRLRKLTIPLVREAKDIIVRRASEADENGRLFRLEKRDRPSRKITLAFKACGIRKINSGRASFHSLRSTFISLMDEAEVLPYITDAITGHCAGDMHGRYSQPTISALRKAVLKAIPPLTPFKKSKIDTIERPIEESFYTNMQRNVRIKHPSHGIGCNESYPYQDLARFEGGGDIARRLMA